MQWIPITATHILTIVFTVLLYLIIYIDGTVIQHATNNVDACTHCAYLFLYLRMQISDADILLSENEYNWNATSTVIDGKIMKPNFA